MKKNFQTIRTIAKNTYIESVRDRVLQIIGVFALVFIGYALFMSTLSLGEDAHVVRTLGLAGIYLLGLVTTIFLGSSLIYREFEQRTLYFVLAKPVSRTQLIIGKFLGLYASIALGIIGMTVVYLGVVAFAGGGFDTLALLAVFFELLEIAVLIALTIFFSSFARPLSAVLYSIIAVYIGHSLGQLMSVAQKSGAFLRYILETIYYVLPNLEKFNIRDMIVYGSAPGMLAIATAVAYALLWVVILLYVALLIFKHREL